MFEEKISAQKLVWWLMTIAVAALAAIGWFWIQSVESRNAQLADEVHEMRHQLASQEAGGVTSTPSVAPNYLRSGPTDSLGNEPNAPLTNGGHPNYLRSGASRVLDSAPNAAAQVWANPDKGM